MKRFYKTLIKTLGYALILALLFAYTGCSAATSRQTENPDDFVDEANQTERSLQKTNSPSAPETTPQPSPVNTTMPPAITDEIEATAKPINPALPLSGRVIGIDPGHQAIPNDEHELISPNGTKTKPKVSQGTYGRFTGVYEYVINLQVGLKLKAKLESLGATVVMTRESHNVDISNAQRAVMMNEAKVDCWIRIHANGNDDESTQGLFFLVPTADTMNTTDPAVQSKSLQLAQTLLAATIKATGAQDRGIDLRSNQTGFSWSSVPVCTLEMGYMTNEIEDNLLVTSGYQDKIVDGLVSGLLEYFNQEQNE